MRSLTLTVVIFVGILAYNNAAPQIGGLTGLGTILAQLAQRLLNERQNSTTVQFGNNSLIVSGIANANAEANGNPSNPQHSHNWHNGHWYNPGFGYYRATPEEIKSIEDNSADADYEEEIDGHAEELDEAYDSLEENNMQPEGEAGYILAEFEIDSETDNASSPADSLEEEEPKSKERTN